MSIYQQHFTAAASIIHEALQVFRVIFRCFDCKLDLEGIYGAFDPGGPPLSTPSMCFS